MTSIKHKKLTVKRSTNCLVAGTALQTSLDFLLLTEKLGQKLGQVHFAFTISNLFESYHFEPVQNVALIAVLPHFVFLVFE
ncbi:hypothetical protein GCM10027454_30050 [Algoriphagus aestuariicola]